MKKLLKNTRGDVPVMILVLLVIAICGLAILSFIIFNKGLLGGGKDSGIEVVEEMNSDIEKFYFYQDVLDDNKAAEMIDDAVINNGKVLITKSNEVVSVKYSFSP